MGVAMEEVGGDGGWSFIERIGGFIGGDYLLARVIGELREESGMVVVLGD